MKKLHLALAMWAGLFVVPTWAAELQPPCEAEVTAHRVYIRSGPGRAFFVMKVAKKGEVLQVRAIEKNAWARVAVPQGVPVWVHQKFVRKEGDELVVTGDELNLRPDSTLKHLPVGQIVKGKRLKFLGQHDVWYKVEPPVEASAFIHARYLVAVGPLPPVEPVIPVVPPKPAEPIEPIEPVEPPLPVDPDATLAKRLAEARSAFLDEMAKPFKWRDFSGPVATCEEIRQKAKTAALRKRAEETLSHLRVTAKLHADFQAELQKYQALPDKVAKLEAEYQKKLASLNPPPPKPEKKFLAEGWVAHAGKVIGRPGTHKLRKNDHVLYLLKSDIYDLNAFFNKFVRMNGKVTPQPRWGADLLEVTEVEVVLTSRQDWPWLRGKPEEK